MSSDSNETKSIRKFISNINQLPHKGSEALKPLRETLQQNFSPLNIKTAQRIQETIPTKEQDKAKITRKTTQDIRLNPLLLTNSQEISTPTPTISNLKTETAKRLSLYTTLEGGWYTLDYKKIGGADHEMGIGLGDILLDLDITEIEIQQNNQKIRATRSYTAQGRPCFKSNDQYATTFTGDKFRIISKKETNEKETKEKELYQTKIDTFKQETEKYKTYLTTHRSQTEKLNLNLQNIKTESIYTDQLAINSLTRNNAENPQEIINYGKKIAQDFNIPWSLLKNIIAKESSWNPNPRQNPHSSASGLGQFLNSTWSEFATFANQNNYKNKYGQNWPENWNTPQGKLNPYVSLCAAAWYIKKSIPKQSSLTPPEQAIHAYLYYHEGPGGKPKYLQFINALQTDGHQTMQEMIIAYNTNPEKYNTHLIPNQKNRITQHGIEKFLSVYFNFALKISEKVAAEEHQETIYAITLDQDPKKYTNSLKPTQANWVFGSSIGVGLNKHLNNALAGTLALQGSTSTRFLNILNQHKQKLSNTQYTGQITLLGLAHNDLTSQTPKQSIAKHLQLVEKLQELFPQATIKIAQAHKYNDQTQDPKIQAFNGMLATDHKDLYLPALQQAQALHPTREEYAQMRNKILQNPQT